MSIIIGYMLLVLSMWLFFKWWTVICVLHGIKKAGNSAKYLWYDDLYNVGNPFI